MTAETRATQPAWIPRIDSLSEIELAQMSDGYPFLRIDDVHAFDLTAWVGAAPWSANAIQPLQGGRRRALRDDIMSRGMDKRPVLERRFGWVADGNTRLCIYDECRRDGVEMEFPGFELREFAEDVARADYQVASAIGQRHLATRERKRLVRDGIRRHPEWTDNRLGILFGLTQDTVTRVSQEMVDAGEIAARPDKRIGADGREYDAPKPKPAPASIMNPTSKLIGAWHRQRGGHGTTSEDVQLLAAAEGIDLAALVGLREDQSERAQRLAVTAWLTTLLGTTIGGLVVAVVRSPSSWCAFSLLRRGDTRASLLPDAATVDSTSENRNA